ncbi:MAG: hypothetical protein IKU09_11985 [Firmicutes bacterium]|nr:hypothetical protein [Bacillota bacterium]
MDNRLDAVIKADLKMIEAELALSSTMMILMVLAVMTLFMSILAIPALLAAIFFIYKGYWKLFYDSVFGASCGLYQALPIPHSQRVLSKIFAASVCGLVPVLVLLIVFAFFNVGMGYGLMGNIFDLIGDIGLQLGSVSGSPMNTALYLSSSVLNLLASDMASVSVIFLAITLYMVQPQEKRTSVRKILTIAVGWLAVKALDFPDWMLKQLKVESPLLESGVDILFQIVVLLVTFRMTVRMMEKHYQKG